ncbi:sulfite exporter TauE/SafE family protein [Chitinophaga filiformis]|uniref:Probable membrane transporter protein n=1 Tax=Chitinophaga filiformis TaxID=104663 RepID=A0ABY4IAX5_CHIFI|nr:sulfite exporter TauE/SafE family protein [Chitinophaga filiformis]UPK72474.1 sulfite exporter TauE/SafE family protein [Chitinophaga filiformis]
MEFLAVGFAVFLAIAFLYSSVGHAGASGYLAVMALLSFPVDTIKSTSLILNIIVASIASYKYIRAGYFDKRIFLAVIFTSIPAAFIGGTITMDTKWFKIIVGIFLIISSIMLVLKGYFVSQDKEEKMPLYRGLTLGAIIGFISGLIGVGGGIFLSPPLILMNWTSIKKASGVTALFILCNSVFALAGHVSKIQKIDHNIYLWILAVAIGGFFGSHFGTKKFNNKIIITFLVLVLLSAGIKFLTVI